MSTFHARAGIRTQSTMTSFLSADSDDAEEGDDDDDEESCVVQCQLCSMIKNKKIERVKSNICKKHQRSRTQYFGLLFGIALHTIHKRN